MKKFDVEIALERIHDAKNQWAKEITQFNTDVEVSMVRLLHEAAANFMSVEDVSRLSGFTPKRIRSMMRDAGLNPRDGKTLLSKKASIALHENAELMGIRPHDMDLTSPLAYLPMGGEMRQALLSQSAPSVTEIPDEDAL